ncbi:AraC family transcriptional regulator [Nostoc sp.]|uniref:AraC family transcriptional regulator n=1 Tax=Nostoc sp. TaxID=1180 RepID=UPI002FF88077
MDVFSDILRVIQLESSVFSKAELTAPWGIIQPSSHDAAFHIVIRGNCCLEVEGQDMPIILAGGDFIVLPHGHQHVLRDDLRTVAAPLASLGKAGQPDETGFIQFGGGGVPTHLICGSFKLDRTLGKPILAVLPPILHIKGENGRAVEWLDTTLQFIACEASSRRPGNQTVIQRLADVLFIQAVRAFLNDPLRQKQGWLDALQSPNIGVALQLMHAQPEASWSVVSLAEKIGMSRSAFATHFTRLVGETPMQYLTKWRMMKAAKLLMSGLMPLTEVAVLCGYESDASFSKVFKRYHGISPGNYRRKSSLSETYLSES